MIRSSRAARVRGLGQPLNLTQYTQHTCPPGYHWVDTPQGPIMGLRTRRMGAMAACVKDPVVVPPPPPPHKIIQLHTGVRPPPAPAPVIPPAVVRQAATRVSISPAPASVTTTEAPLEQPAEDLAVCPKCWPWWWLLVAGAAGGVVAGVVRASKKKKKGERRINPYVARMVNAGTHHVIRAVMR